MPYNHTLHPENSFTLNLWAYSDDWNNVIGHQIAGNYYIGGFGIFNNNGSFTPQIAAFWDESSGWIGTINQEGNIISQRMFDEKTQFDQVVTNTNRGIYLLDNKNNKIVVLDTDLVQTDEIPLQNIIKQMEIAPDNSIYLLTKENHIYRIFQGCDDLPTSIGGLGFNACWNRIHIRKDGTLVTAQSDFPIFSDCDNNTYWIYGNNIYKGSNTFPLGRVFYHLPNTRAGMVMDLNDNIYVYYGSGRMVKIDKDGKTVFDTLIHSITELKGEYEKISMSVTREFTSTGYKDYIWVVMEDRNYILKVDTSTGKMIRCVQVPLLVDLQRYSSKIKIENFKLRGYGDMTGYELAKKRSCGANKKTLQAKVLIKDPDCDSFIPVELNYETKNLKAGWHMFTLSFNKTTGIISLYVDAVLVDSESGYSNHTIYYKYYSPFLIGADSGKYQSLEAENQTKNPIYNNIVVRDVKLFGKILDPKILKGDSLLSVKSEKVYMLGNLISPIRSLETVNKILVNQKPYKNNKFLIKSDFIKNLPNACGNVIKEKIETENKENISFQFDFD